MWRSAPSQRTVLSTARAGQRVVDSRVPAGSDVARSASVSGGSRGPARWPGAGDTLRKKAGQLQAQLDEVAASIEKCYALERRPGRR